MSYFNELYRYRYEDLQIGMTDLYTHTMTETDIRMFAALSGDNNPVHLNEDFAQQTRFGGRIAHGMISVSFFSALFGTRLPGPGAIYVSQTLRFRAPVKIGDTVIARIRISQLQPERRMVTFDTTCHVGEKIVISGQAEIYVPSEN